MPKASATRAAQLAQILKQSLLSSAVVVSFAAYAVHERLNGATDVLIAPTPVPTKVIAASVPTLTRTPTVTPRAAEPTLPRDTPTLIAPTRTPLPSPTAHPLANPLARGSYKDGEFVGTVADAYFGPLQVKAVIENGKLTDVQFLDYPKSRRTSQRINDRAMPVLKTEAVRAQNAQVDVVSGATLTSKAFMQSLQVALNKAK